MLNERLDDRNFKSIAYKQDELHAIMHKLTNHFNMFYLLENYSKDFNAFNLASYIKRLALIIKTNNEVEFIMTQRVKSLLTKMIVNQVPHMLSIDCYQVFQRLGSLKFTLNDQTTKAMLQILKYHVNDLDLDQLIQMKKNVDFLQRNNPNPNEINEYVEPFEKAVVLAVQLKYQTCTTPHQAVKLLKYYYSKLSDGVFNEIIGFVNSKYKDLKLDSALELTKVLADKNLKHLSLLNKITYLILRAKNEDMLAYRFTSLEMVETSSQEKVFMEVLHVFQEYFLKLKFYDTKLLDFVIDKTIELSKDQNITTMFDKIKMILKSCVYFQHKRQDFIDLLLERKINEHFEKEDFPVTQFLFYAGLINYKK
jgi:hypothetical protein